MCARAQHGVSIVCTEVAVPSLVRVALRGGSRVIFLAYLSFFEHKHVLWLRFLVVLMEGADPLEIGRAHV